MDFRAERVEIAPDAGSLALSGAVVVKLARFRLTSEAVKLSRSPRGVHVEGKGELGLCPCAKPPITFGFHAADLAPPTDVLLQGATLRVAGVPVFWSPYLWLRAPERMGLLPPSLAYRGEEGFLLGSGVLCAHAWMRAWGVSPPRCAAFPRSRPASCPCAANSALTVPAVGAALRRRSG